MTQLDVKILHQDYVLTCPEGKESQLLEAVERVDNQFESMRASSKLRSRERIGVLLSVNLAFENLELRQQLQTLQQQLAQRGDWAGEDELSAPEPAQQALEALQAQVQQDATVAAQLLSRIDAVLAAPVAASDSQRPETAPDLSSPASLPASGTAPEPLAAADALAYAGSSLALATAAVEALQAAGEPAEAAEIGLLDSMDGSNLPTTASQAL